MEEEITIRHPKASDGAAVWALAREAGVDDNSVYCYLLLCNQFAESTAVAVVGERIVGFSVGFRVPDEPETLFVWQVGVAADFKGRGLARQMILWLCRRPENPVRMIDATVTPSNVASQALFRSIARELDAYWEYEEDMFTSTDFGAVSHEPERLFRIGPIKDQEE